MHVKIEKDTLAWENTELLLSIFPLCKLLVVMSNNVKHEDVIFIVQSDLCGNLYLCGGGLVIEDRI
jgi:hypothetical protein